MIVPGEVEQAVDDQMGGMVFEADALLRRLARACFMGKRYVAEHFGRAVRSQREKVFARFYRTASSRARAASQGGGAGLGLSIAATIVQQHRGSIGVAETPGGGSTFWVELQAAEVDEEHTVTPDQARSVTERPGAPEDGDQPAS